MGSENFNVLEELKSLDQQIGVVNDLMGLKPIFNRLGDIAREYSDDFEVQLVVGDIKQHLVTRGARLKEQKDNGPEAPIRPAGAPPTLILPPTETMPVAPPAPVQASGEPTLISPPSGGPSRLPTSPMAVPSVPPDIPVAAADAWGSPGPPTLPSMVLPKEALPKEALPTQAMPIQGMPSSAPPPVPSLPSQQVPSQLGPTEAMQVPPVPPPASRPPVDWKRAMWMGAVLGAIIAVLLLAVVVNLARKRNAKTATESTEVALDIATVPPGASVRVNSETKCNAPCKISLPPGNYQITAFLDGYEPFGSGVTLATGEPKSLNLPLEPQAQSLRILTDFDKGKVLFDDQPPADLQDGQYLFEKVAPGPHVVKVTSANREASFSFELADAKLPSITGTLTAKNVLAVLVSSFANQARVVTSMGPWKLTANGQPEDDAGPAGVDLKTFKAGTEELVIDDGKNHYNVSGTFGPAPMLTAKLLTPEQNTGTLIVATEENDVTVFVNDRKWPTRTTRGQLRISTLPPGNVNVRVSKQGFEDQPAKTATLKKGEDTRLEFKLKPAVQVSSLEIVGAAPGTEVRIDQKMLGTVGSDGGLKNASIPPGSHSIELSRSQFNPRSSTRNFVAGQTVTLSGLDVQLAEKAPTPPPPVEAPKPPPPAPKPAPVVASAPAPRTLLMDSFEDPSQWKEDNGVFRHKGKGFFAYKVPAKGGVLTTNIYLIRGGGIISGARLRWRVNQTDEKNYTEFNLDDDTLYTRDFVNGKSTDQKKKHNIPSKDKKDKVWAIKIDLSSDKVVTQMQKDQDWITIDTFAPAGRNLLDGKFGFWIQGGGDEMGLSDLTFKPR